MWNSIPPFSAAVLEPGFDLCVCHLQTLGQGCSLGAGQILLPMETLLQLADLDSGEGGPRLFPFWRGSVLVRVSYSSCDSERHQSCWSGQDESSTVRRRLDFIQQQTDQMHSPSVWKFKVIYHRNPSCLTTIPYLDCVSLCEKCEIQFIMKYESGHAVQKVQSKE